jgi:hypothetical protein
MPAPPLVSLAIPLWMSARFLPTLRQNLAAIDEPSVEVLISDRHGLDDTIEILREEWGDDPRFRFFAYRDGIDWVAHLNTLLTEARGRYFRWMPHDDVFPRGSLPPLVRALNGDERALLAYGPTTAIGASGERLPKLDRADPHPVATGEPWQLRHSLDFFWKGYCDGAFKGLFRRDRVIAAGLTIRPTYQLVHAERTWLFAMSLLGDFRFVAESPYVKRHHPWSAHASWTPDSRHITSATLTMCDYLRDHAPAGVDRRRANAYLLARAAERLAGLNQPPADTAPTEASKPRPVFRWSADQ